jgi:uncharacterized protein (DUF3084 family)
MTDVQHEHGTNRYEPTVESQSFTDLAQRLLDEHDKLTELAELCRTQAQTLAEREAEMGGRQRELDGAWERFNSESRELTHREEEIERKLQVVAEAEQRIQEARERETHLAALGSELLERFGKLQQPDG